MRQRLSRAFRKLVVAAPKWTTAAALAAVSRSLQLLAKFSLIVVKSYFVHAILIYVNLHILNGAVRAREQARFAAAVRVLEDAAKDEGVMKQIAGNLPSWVDFEEWERGEWFNAMWKGIWPWFEKFIADFVKQDLERALKDGLPAVLSGFTFVKVSFGHEAPRPFGVKKVDLSRDGELFVAADLDVKWAGKPDIVMKLMPKSRWQLMSTVDLTPAMYIRINSLRVAGKFRLTFGPVVIGGPLFKGMRVAVLSKPDLDFTVKVLGGADIMSLPAIRTWLRACMDAQLELLRPPGFPIDFVWEDDSQTRSNAPIGIITVSICAAMLRRRPRRRGDGLWSIAMLEPELGIDGGLFDDIQNNRTHLSKPEHSPDWGCCTFHLVVYSERQELKILLGQHFASGGLDGLPDDVLLGVLEVPLHPIILGSDHAPAAAPAAAAATTAAPPPPRPAAAALLNGTAGFAAPAAAEPVVDGRARSYDDLAYLPVPSRLFAAAPDSPAFSAPGDAASGIDWLEADPEAHIPGGTRVCSPKRRRGKRGLLWATQHLLPGKGRGSRKRRARGEHTAAPRHRHPLRPFLPHNKTAAAAAAQDDRPLGQELAESSSNSSDRAAAPRSPRLTRGSEDGAAQLPLPQGKAEGAGVALGGHADRRMREFFQQLQRPFKDLQGVGVGISGRTSGSGKGAAHIRNSGSGAPTAAAAEAEAREAPFLAEAMDCFSAETSTALEHTRSTFGSSERREAASAGARAPPAAAAPLPATPLPATPLPADAPPPLPPPPPPPLAATKSDPGLLWMGAAGEDSELLLPGGSLSLRDLTSASFDARWLEEAEDDSPASAPALPVDARPASRPHRPASEAAPAARGSVPEAAAAARSARRRSQSSYRLIDLPSSSTPSLSRMRAFRRSSRSIPRMKSPLGNATASTLRASGQRQPPQVRPRKAGGRGCARHGSADGAGRGRVGVCLQGCVVWASQGESHVSVFGGNEWGALAAAGLGEAGSLCRDRGQRGAWLLVAIPTKADLRNENIRCVMQNSASAGQAGETVPDAAADVGEEVPAGLHGVDAVLHNMEGLVGSLLHKAQQTMHSSRPLLRREKSWAADSDSGGNCSPMGSLCPDSLPHHGGGRMQLAAPDLLRLLPHRPILRAMNRVCRARNRVLKPAAPLGSQADADAAETAAQPRPEAPDAVPASPFSCSAPSRAAGTGSDAGTAAPRAEPAAAAGQSEDGDITLLGSPDVLLERKYMGVVKLALQYTPLAHTIPPTSGGPAGGLPRRPKLGVLVVKLMTLAMAERLNRPIVSIIVGNQIKRTTMRDRWGVFQETLRGGTCDFMQTFSFALELPPPSAPPPPITIRVTELSSRLRSKVWAYFTAASSSTLEKYGKVKAEAHVHMREVLAGNLDLPGIPGGIRGLQSTWQAWAPRAAPPDDQPGHSGRAGRPPRLMGHVTMQLMWLPAAK